MEKNYKILKQTDHAALCEVYTGDLTETTGFVVLHKQKNMLGKIDYSYNPHFTKSGEEAESVYQARKNVCLY